MTVLTLSANHVGEIVSTLSDAFHDYPVMRHVLGPAEPYEERLTRLVTLFVNGRAHRNEPMMGTRDADGNLTGASIVSIPTSQAPPPAFVALREAIWAELGADARGRYDDFVAATAPFAIAKRHHHLNMIGVRRAHQGRRLARGLLEAVHALAAADPHSAGVSLTTEYPPNVPLYEHFGYRVLGHARVSPQLETWTLFRRTAPS